MFKSVLKNRLFIDFVVLTTLIFTPWWVSLICATIALIYIVDWYEGLLWAVFFDDIHTFALSTHLEHLALYSFVIMYISVRFIKSRLIL